MVFGAWHDSHWGGKEILDVLNLVDMADRLQLSLSGFFNFVLRWQHSVISRRYGKHCSFLRRFCTTPEYPVAEELPVLLGCWIMDFMIRR
jgi:hypothetical protein